MFDESNVNINDWKRNYNKRMKRKQREFMDDLSEDELESYNKHLKTESDRKRKFNELEQKINGIKKDILLEKIKKAVLSFEKKNLQKKSRNSFEEKDIVSDELINSIDNISKEIEEIEKKIIHLSADLSIAELEQEKYISPLIIKHKLSVNYN